MIVLSLVNAPEKTKGYASRYLLEISPSVYIGNLDAKTRTGLWDYVRGNLGATGYASLVISRNNAQGYEIFTQNSSERKEIIDFDGLKMIMKKHFSNKEKDEENNGKKGWSKYSFYSKRRKK